MNKKIVVLLCGLMVASAATAQQRETEVVDGRIAAARSDLRLIQPDEGRVGDEFAVRANGRVVVQPGGKENDFRLNDLPLAHVLPPLDQGVVPFDEVLVLRQRMWGNGCDNGSIWFLGATSDGSYTVAEALDDCGGVLPILTVLPEKVTYADPWPAGGGEFIPPEVWVYAPGRAGRVQQAQKKNR